MIAPHITPRTLAHWGPRANPSATIETWIGGSYYVATSTGSLVTCDMEVAFTYADDPMMRLHLRDLSTLTESQRKCLEGDV